MTNQEACSQPEMSPWQIPELFHNLPFFQDSELVGTDSQYHGISLIVPQQPGPVSATWGLLSCSLCCGAVLSNTHPPIPTLIPPRLQKPQE